MCRSWGCSYCNPIRRRQLVREATWGNPNRLITITVSPTLGTGPADRAARLARAWRVVVARARRQLKRPPGERWAVTGEPRSRRDQAIVDAIAASDDKKGNVNLDYLAVFEATKKGEPHLHILTRSYYIPQDWLSQQLADLIDSPIVDIRRINDGRRAVAYVTKYIGKDPHHFATCKRYWSTPGYDARSEAEKAAATDPTANWRVDERPLHAIMRAWSKTHPDVLPSMPFSVPTDYDWNLTLVTYGAVPPRDHPPPEGHSARGGSPVVHRR